MLLDEAMLMTAVDGEIRSVVLETQYFDMVAETLQGVETERVVLPVEETLAVPVETSYEPAFGFVLFDNVGMALAGPVHLDASYLLVNCSYFATVLSLPHLVVQMEPFVAAGRHFVAVAVVVVAAAAVFVVEFVVFVGILTIVAVVG
jgi:hypothetical protein